MEIVGVMAKHEFSIFFLEFKKCWEGDVEN